MSTRLRPTFCKLLLLLAAAAAATFADTIDFENQCLSGQTASGPCSGFYNTVGNATQLSIPTPAGNVIFQGGALFDNIAYLPSDETAVYGTAGNAANIGVNPGSGFTNPLTIIFPMPITSFSLDVLNGNTMTVDYRLADNAGNLADFQIAPNLSGGVSSVGLVTAGNVVTVTAETGQSTPSGMTWDFLIDNITFTSAVTQTSATPEPRSSLLIGIGLVVLGLCRRSKKFVLALLPAAVLLVPAISSAATTSQGLTSPALTLSDNYGNSLSIDATGNAMCTGACTTANSSASTPGNVSWTGTLGIFNISVAGGQTKPALPPAQITLGLRVITGALGAGADSPTLTAKWSDVGFNGTGPVKMVASDSLAGPVTASYSGYVDSSNALFGTGTLVGTAGPGGNAAGSGPLGEPFSMTLAATVTMGANASYTLTSLNLMAAPVLPLTLACPSASGQLNVAYDSHLVAGGGIPPYAYSTIGSLPTGLGLNPSTGGLSGTPTATGTFPFTAQVADSSGNTGKNTLQTPCSITITNPPAPLSLACPDPTDQEDIYYSSSLVATGGMPPYSFSFSSGSLPPGLSLNPSTGAITGTDTTAAGNFSFVGKVIDSSGAAPANQALQNCLLVAQAPTLRMVAGNGTTPQTVVVNSVLNTPLSVVVTNTTTGMPAAGITVTFTATLIPAGTPSGTFSGGTNNDIGTLNSVTAATNASGVATAPAFTANTVVGGPYNVTASSRGVNNTVTFRITNTPGVPFYIVPVPNPYPGQTTAVNTNFRNTLSAQVKDRFGNVIPNCPVLFSAPALPNPGATFGNAGAQTATVNTNANGLAVSPAVKANTKIGTYSITAAVVQLVPGQVLPLPASFPNMTNTPGPPAVMTQVPAAGDPTVSGGGVHYATVNTLYSTLRVVVTDSFGNPLPNVTVNFRSTDPLNGPGATFAGAGARAFINDRQATNANGVATADPLTANGFQGTFDVVVTTVPATAARTTFSMENVGRIGVPLLTGLTQAQATARLTSSLLAVGNVTRATSKTVAAGSVISQNPAAGTNVSAGARVDLVISTGK